LLALHIGDDGGLIAIDCEFFWSRAFIKKEAFEKHPERFLDNPTYVEHIEPLTEEDETLFHPPDLNATDANGEKVE